MANEALESLQRTLIQILQRSDDFINRRVKLQIIRIHDRAVVLQLNLKHFREEEETFMEVANAAAEIIHHLFSPENLSDFGLTEAAPAVRLWGQLEELAKELESTAGDMVDYISSSSSSSHEDLTLPVELSITISHRLRRLVGKIKPAADFDVDEHLCTEDLRDNDVASSFTFTEDVVGSEDDREHVIDQLLSTSSTIEPQCLMIVGMAGIGKSTLAKTVYESAMIKDHFDIRAWVTISQDSSAESVLSNLLASIEESTQQVEGETTDLEGISNGFLGRLPRESGMEIHRHLNKKRYLVVLDNVWSTKLWGDLRDNFPQKYDGSRILLTTRLMNLAETYWCSIHTMQLLDEQESWDLFQRRVFGDQTCPLELQRVAEKIVKRCDGLPLLIVTKARLIYRIDRIPKLWQQIVDNDKELATLTSSYNHLPPHLKKCFLFMAAFPVDYEIHASQLVKLWIAEGFFECIHEYKSLEELGGDYLDQLFHESLILITNRKIYGKGRDGSIKTCKLHRAVRDFCVRRAEQEKFLLPVMDYLPTSILRRHFLPKLLENNRRISVSWYDLKDSMHGSCTHSIICIPQKGYKPKASVRNFTSLRVLHVLRRKDHSYWEIGQVFDLVHLKYLASYIPTNIVPPAISKLQNLQTLIIYRHEVRLPVEIWRLRQLRHLIAFSFHRLPHPREEVFPLKNLQTLCLVTDFVCSARMVEMIPNIRKLGICYSQETLDEDYSLHGLLHLIRLQRLNLERRGLFCQRLNLVFPQSLKKLTLSGWRLPWNDLMIVHSLPNLEVLKLRNYACDGECWETTMGAFNSLRLLLIDESNLQHWNTESSHFPSLQSLMLYRCPCLSELPCNLGDIPVLTNMWIDDSNQSLSYSAKRIQEERLTVYGKDDLRVHLVHV